MQISIILQRGIIMDIKKLEPKRKQGLVVVITGNGKGKTTSAMGMALRATGHRMRVCIIQFMKGDLYSGEWDGVKFLDKKPSDLHLILTGRDAHPEIIERADTVSEVREIKHAYTKGIEPQPGIDY